MRLGIAVAEQPVPEGDISVRAGVPDREREARKLAGARETVDARRRDVRIACAVQRHGTQEDAIATFLGKLWQAIAFMELDEKSTGTKMYLFIAVLFEAAI